MKYVKLFIILIFTMCALFSALLYAGNNADKTEDMKMPKNIDLPKNINLKDAQTATFAGGCFWCVESDFEKIEGVIEVVSGYTGGREKNPSYKEVSSGSTGHVEAVQVYFDPSKISYNDLLDVFWKHVDPTDQGGQFVDRGSQYVTAIFFHNDEQKQAAEASKKNLALSGKFEKQIVTEIIAFTEFYEAEDYHQDYYKNSPVRYKFYRHNSGRDRFLEKVWGNDNDKSEIKDKGKYSKPSDDILRQKLNDLQYKVTQKEGTEPPFNNEYWDNKKKGIYVDIASEEPLFSSVDKFDSGTGWPSFTRPLEKSNILEKKDSTLFMVRTEVRSRHGDSHLGHLFDDGPKPTGLRYCINSASLKFIPVEELEEKGYGEYLPLFK